MGLVQNHYKDWVDLELDQREKIQVAVVKNFVTKALQKSNAPAEFVSALKFEFTKASLTISPEERLSGAFHKLADGQPFYQMGVSVDGSKPDPNNKGMAFLFMLSQVLATQGGAGLSMANPAVLNHEFRGDIILKSKPLMDGVAAIGKYLFVPKP